MGSLSWTALLTALVLCTPRPAQSRIGLAAELRSAGGYDSRAYADVGALPTEVDRVAGPLMRFEPELAGVLLLGDHLLTLQYKADVRQLFIHDAEDETLIVHGATLDHRAPIWAGIVVAAQIGFRDLRTLELEGGGWTGGWLAVKATRAFAELVRLGIGYDVFGSGYRPASAARWVVAQRWQVEASWRLARGLRATPRYAFHLRHADPFEIGSIDHQGGLSVSWDLPWLPLDARLAYASTAVSYRGPVTRTNPMGKPLPQKEEGRFDWVHRVEVELSCAPRPWLEISASYALLAGDSDLEANYTRHLALIGVAARWSWLQPRRRVRRRLRVAHRAPTARRVSVVGSFNGWDPARHPARRNASGTWYAEIDLPPGRYTYMLWVDGAIRAPSCSTRQADGFGGHSCVLVVEP